jgi:hypothetical protein
MALSNEIFEYCVEKSASVSNINHGKTKTHLSDGIFEYCLE